MRLIPDTNILVRALTNDDREQSPEAQRILAEAELVAVTTTTLCELCWVLLRSYKIHRQHVALAIERLASSENVELDRPAVEAGLALLTAGGDFADGIIAHQGEWLGGETFVSFDRKAISLLKAANKLTLVPGDPSPSH